MGNKTNKTGIHFKVPGSSMFSRIKKFFAGPDPPNGLSGQDKLDPAALMEARFTGAQYNAPIRVGPREVDHLLLETREIRPIQAVRDGRVPSGTDPDLDLELLARMAQRLIGKGLIQYREWGPPGSELNLDWVIPDMAGGVLMFREFPERFDLARSLMRLTQSLNEREAIDAYLHRGPWLGLLGRNFTVPIAEMYLRDEVVANIMLVSIDRDRMDKWYCDLAAGGPLQNLPRFKPDTHRHLSFAEGAVVMESQLRYSAPVSAKEKRAAAEQAVIDSVLSTGSSAMISEC